MNSLALINLKSCTKIVSIVSFLLVSLISQAAESTDSYGIIFMDRSGSMMIDRPDGQSRCSYSKQQTIHKISKFFFDNNIKGQQIDVKAFSSGGQVNSLTGGFVGFVDAMTAMNSLDAEGCSGLTALAEAMCDAADQLRNKFSIEAYQGAILRVYGSTDGDENDSPEAYCGGTNWQEMVYNKYLNEFPAVQFNATIYTGTVQSVSSSLSINSTSVNMVAGKALSNSVSNVEVLMDSQLVNPSLSNPTQSIQVIQTNSVDTFDFLRNLAADTGGETDVIPDDHGTGDPIDW